MCMVQGCRVLQQGWINLPRMTWGGSGGRACRPMFGGSAVWSPPSQLHHGHCVLEQDIVATDHHKCVWMNGTWNVQVVWVSWKAPCKSSPLLEDLLINATAPQWQNATSVEFRFSAELEPDWHFPPLSLSGSAGLGPWLSMCCVLCVFFYLSSLWKHDLSHTWHHSSGCKKKAKICIVTKENKCNAQWLE